MICISDIFRNRFHFRQSNVGEVKRKKLFPRGKNPLIYANSLKNFVTCLISKIYSFDY